MVADDDFAQPDASAATSTTNEKRRRDEGRPFMTQKIAES
jgi:hypothetical protein